MFFSIERILVTCIAAPAANSLFWVVMSVTGVGVSISIQMTLQGTIIWQLELED